MADDTPSVRLTQVSATLAPEAFIVEACAPLSAGILSPGHLFRQLLVVPGHAGAGADIDLTAAYVARFTAPAAGQRVFVRLAMMTQGFKDTPRQWDALVAPHGS